MKEYEVEIIETLQKTITIEENSPEEAAMLVETGYKNEEYVLDADHFVDVDFRTIEDLPKISKSVLNNLNAFKEQSANKTSEKTKEQENTI